MHVTNLPKRASTASGFTLALIVLAACGSNAGPANGAAPADSAAKAASPAPLTHVKIGLTSKSTGGLYLYVGKDLGIFQKHGIDPEIVIGQSAGLVTGLNQGDLDFLGVIPPAIQGAEQGLPIRGIYVAKDHPEYLLVGDIGVSQVSQLKGKDLAGSNPAQLPSLMLKELLRLDGLNPADYTIIIVADDPARAALVANHKAAAGILGTAEAMPLLNAGHPLIDSTLSKIFTPSNGLAATLTTLQKRRDVAQRTVEAAVEANNIAANDKQRSLGVLTKEFELSEADAGKLFDLLQPTYTKSGRPDPRAVKFQLETDAQAMQLKQVATEDQVYDFSLLPPVPSGS